MFAVLFWTIGDSFAQKIGSIKLNEIVKNSKIGQRYMSILKSKSDDVKKQLRSLELKASKISREISSSVLSEEVKNQKRIEFENLRRKAQMVISKFQQEKAKLEQELLGKLKDVIKEFGDKKGYDLILVEDINSGIIYSNKSIDITNELIMYINKKLK